MAMLTAESFGSSNAASDYEYLLLHRGSYASGTLVIGANGPFGDPYMTIFNQYGNNGGEYLIGSAIAAGCVGYRARNVGAGSGLMLFDPASNPQLGFGIAFNGAVSVSRGDGAVLWTGGAVLTPGWRYIEFGFVIDATAGSFTVQVDGAVLTTQSGVNTKGSTASSAVASVYFTGNQDVAHIYVNDTTGPAPNNGLLGDTRVVNVLPSAPGDSTQFTPVGNAANWQNAATSPPQPGIDHNDSSTVGALDLFRSAGVPAGMGEIYGVQLRSRVSKGDGGNRSMANVVKSGTAQANGATNAVAAGVLTMRDMVPLDPATGAAWTRAAVDAAQIGYTVVA